MWKSFSFVKALIWWLYVVIRVIMCRLFNKFKQGGYMAELTHKPVRRGRPWGWIIFLVLVLLLFTGGWYYVPGLRSFVEGFISRFNEPAPATSVAEVVPTPEVTPTLAPTELAAREAYRKDLEVYFDEQGASWSDAGKKSPKCLLAEKYGRGLKLLSAIDEREDGYKNKGCNCFNLMLVKEFGSRKADILTRHKRVASDYFRLLKESSKEPVVGIGCDKEYLDEPVEAVRRMLSVADLERYTEKEVGVKIDFTPRLYIDAANVVLSKYRTAGDETSKSEWATQFRAAVTEFKMSEKDFKLTPEEKTAFFPGS